MNIYKVSRTTPTNYDTYSEFICFAENEEQAKNMNPSFVTVFDPRFEEWKTPEWHMKLYIDWSEHDELYNPWVKNTTELNVKFLGTSNYINPGIILASYHAG